MAHSRIFKRSDRKGFWHIDYFDPEHNRRVRKNLKTTDKRTAENILSELRKSLAYKEAGLPVPSQILKKDHDLFDFLSEYLKYIEGRLAQKSVERYRCVIDNFRTFLEIKYAHLEKLSHLEGKVFDDYQIYRRNESYTTVNGKTATTTNPKKNPNTNTINFEIMTLKTALNQAVKWDWLDENPIKEIRKLKVIDAKPPRFLTHKEVELLLNNTPKNLSQAFATLLYTGMRRGEINNLEWSDIDFKRRKIRIRMKPFWQPKSGERDIPISDELLKVLKSVPKKNNFVFVTKNNKQLSQNALRDSLCVYNQD